MAKGKKTTDEGESQVEKKPEPTEVGAELLEDGVVRLTVGKAKAELTPGAWIDLIAGASPRGRTKESIHEARSLHETPGRGKSGIATRADYEKALKARAKAEGGRGVSHKKGARDADGE